MKKHWTILMLPALLLTLAACGVEHPTLEDGDRGIGHAGGGGSAGYTGPAHRLSTDRGCRPGQGGHRAGLRHHPGHGPEQRGLRRGGLFRHPGQPDRALDLSDHERPCTGRAPRRKPFLTSRPLTLPRNL